MTSACDAALTGTLLMTNNMSPWRNPAVDAGLLALTSLMYGRPDASGRLAPTENPKPLGPGDTTTSSSSPLSDDGVRLVVGGAAKDHCASLTAEVLSSALDCGAECAGISAAAAPSSEFFCGRRRLAEKDRRPPLRIVISDVAEDSLRMLTASLCVAVSKLT